MNINKIDNNVWECNGLWIEHDFYGSGEYSVQFCGDNLIFESFAEAVRFCCSV